MKIQLLFDDIILLSRPGQISSCFISQELDSLYEVVLNSLVLNDMINLQVSMTCHFHQKLIGEGAFC